MTRIPALDISIWDEGIDLNEWKRKHGIGAVIVKCGGNEGGRYVDRCFADHMRKAQDAGLAAGVYFYTTSTTINAAIADADYCVNLIHGHALRLPVFMDVEDAEQFKLSPRELTDVIKAFCDRVQERGYRAGLYTGGFAWNNNMYPDELRKYCTWIASWQASWPTYVGKIDMWQQGTKRLSDGHVFYDDVDGCQDFDWIEDYVIQGGDKMSKLFNPAEEIAELHAWMCTDPAFGYNIDRPGGMKPTGMREFTTTSGRTYRIMGGDYSCSTSIITVTKAVFARTKYAHAFDAATFTGDMRAAYVSSGLYEAKYSPAKRGDIYLNEGVHTALCQDGGNDGVFGYDCLSEFNRSEDPNDRYHGKSGDQDGYESVIRAYYDDNWNIILHYIGGLIEDLMWEDEDKDKESVIEVTMPILFTAKEINKVYYWNGDPECVPYHVSPAERDAIIEVYGIKVRVLSLATVNALLGMGKARKAWREEGIKAVLASDTVVG